jgi:NDP-sugar pyrophosphorylase family protein
MKAVVLAAGRGTRLAPLTDSVPKILAPLGDQPLLAHQLRYLRSSGVTEVAVNVSHHADQLRSFLDGAGADLVRVVSYEPEPLGTAGALLCLRAFLTEPFLVLYGDVVTDASLGDLMERHRRANGIATLAYYESSETEAKGVLWLGADGRVERFVEKPQAVEGRVAVSAGIYALAPRILDFITPERPDFGSDVWPAIIAAGEPVYGHRIDGYLRDIGSPDALREAQQDLARGRIRW